MGKDEEKLLEDVTDGAAIVFPMIQMNYMKINKFLKLKIKISTFLTIKKKIKISRKKLIDFHIIHLDHWKDNCSSIHHIFQKLFLVFDNLLCKLIQQRTKQIHLERY